jgi:hypothetical protein
MQLAKNPKTSKAIAAYFGVPFVVWLILILRLLFI